MITSFRKLIAVAVLGTMAITSCTKPEPEVPEVKNAFRQAVNTSLLNDTSNYTESFTANGVSTVDLTQGNDRLNIFKAFDAYGKSPASSGATISATTLKNMLSNTGNPFSGSYEYLNSSSENIWQHTAVNAENRSAEMASLEDFINKLAATSAFASQTAGEGQAGIITNSTGSKYLVDDKGVEWVQVILKSLIGAYQLDHISNTLLSESSLNANNTQTLSGKNYSALENNWDQAYASLTTRNVYGSAAGSSSGESFLGSYVWEYNPTGFTSIHPAFIQGRAAIVNGDKNTLFAKATSLRAEFEKTMAYSALAYLEKFKTSFGVDNGKAAHAYAEGAGFIYSLRFCKLNGANAAWSDEVLNDIHLKTTGIWNLSATEVNTAIAKIKSKFNIQ